MQYAATICIKVNLIAMHFRFNWKMTAHTHHTYQLFQWSIKFRARNFEARCLQFGWTSQNIAAVVKSLLQRTKLSFFLIKKSQFSKFEFTRTEKRLQENRLNYKNHTLRRFFCHCLPIRVPLKHKFIILFYFCVARAPRF